jgi:hypothetical protein
MKNFLNRFVLRSKQISGYLIHGMTRKVFKFKNTGETDGTDQFDRSSSKREI